MQSTSEPDVVKATCERIESGSMDVEVCGVWWIGKVRESSKRARRGGGAAKLDVHLTCGASWLRSSIIHRGKRLNFNLERDMVGIKAR